MFKFFASILIFCSVILYDCKTPNQTLELSLELLKAKSSTDESYGYTIENPIGVKYKDVNSDTVIIYFVKNLIDIDRYNSFSGPYKIIDLKELSPKNGSLDKIIKECTIRTSDGAKTIKLYFDPDKSIKELKVPRGFFYTRLTG